MIITAMSAINPPSLGEAALLNFNLLPYCIIARQNYLKYFLNINGIPSIVKLATTEAGTPFWGGCTVNVVFFMAKAELFNPKDMRLAKSIGELGRYYTVRGWFDAKAEEEERVKLIHLENPKGYHNPNLTDCLTCHY